LTKSPFFAIFIGLIYLQDYSLSRGSNDLLQAFGGGSMNTYALQTARKAGKGEFPSHVLLIVAKNGTGEFEEFGKVFESWTVQVNGKNIKLADLARKAPDFVAQLEEEVAEEDPVGDESFPDFDAIDEIVGRQVSDDGASHDAGDLRQETVPSTETEEENTMNTMSEEEKVFLVKLGADALDAETALTESKVKQKIVSGEISRETLIFNELPPGFKKAKDHPIVRHFDFPDRKADVNDEGDEPDPTPTNGPPMLDPNHLPHADAEWVDDDEDVETSASTSTSGGDGANAQASADVTVVVVNGGGDRQGDAQASTDAAPPTINTPKPAIAGPADTGNQEEIPDPDDTGNQEEIPGPDDDTAPHATADGGVGDVPAELLEEIRAAARQTIADRMATADMLRQAREHRTAANTSAVQARNAARADFPVWARIGIPAALILALIALIVGLIGWFYPIVAAAVPQAPLVSAPATTWTDECRAEAVVDGDTHVICRAGNVQQVWVARGALTSDMLGKCFDVDQDVGGSFVEKTGCPKAYAFEAVRFQ